MIYVFCVILSYLMGSIPMGLILARVAGKGDLRQVGSGNIGATNVMRVGGLRLAGLTWILDMAKAAVAVLLGTYVAGDAFGAWCGCAAIVGHCWPVWLRFRGGKGISCMFGMLLALSPLAFIICGIEWLIVALGTGYSSAGAIVAMIVMPILGIAMAGGVFWPLLVVMIIAMWRHRENILRLVRGAESRVEWKWKK